MTASRTAAAFVLVGDANFQLSDVLFPAGNLLDVVLEVIGTSFLRELGMTQQVTEIRLAY